MFSFGQTPLPNGETKRRRTQDAGRTTDRRPATTTTTTTTTTSANDSDVADRTIDILSRRYPLTRTNYKFIEVCVTVGSPSSRVNVKVGDSHGKEISFSPETWRGLVDRRREILSRLRNDDDDDDGSGGGGGETRVGDLTVRFGRINDLPILRLGTSASPTRVPLSLNTVLVMYGLDHCVARMIASLETIVRSVDEKRERFSDLASTVERAASVPEAIRGADFYDRGNIVDCELASLCF